MTKSLENIRIYGDGDGAVWVAPLGTAFPTGLAAYDEDDFTESGWTSEDGVSIAKEEDSSAFNAWQGGKVVRRRVTSSEDTFTFQALEETALTVGLYLPGAEITTNTGVTKIVPANGVPTDERCFGLDFFDGDVHKRYNVIRGEVSERQEIPHQNTEMTVYGFTVTMYEYEIYTNNPALVA